MHTAPCVVIGHAEVRAVLADPFFAVPPAPAGVPTYADIQRLSG